jgi:predicted GNAT family N-acyltransferase
MINSMAGKMTDLQIEARKISSEGDIRVAQQIRYDVFVIGQHVPAEEEIDQYENSSHHFLAKVNGIPCGAARWRITNNGVKLERFAVLDNFRGMGVGSALVEAVLKDIECHPKAKSKQLYLHAQISAMPLYQKFGFVRKGEMFQECDIDHYAMKKAR